MAHTTDALLDAHQAVAERQDPAARATLLAEYEPNARAIARRFYRYGEPLEDLVQVALEATLLAIDRFDPSRGTPFVAYATPTVVGTLKRYFRDHGWAVRVPRRVHDLAGPIAHATAMLEQDLGGPPTNAEIADLLDIDVAVVDDVKLTTSCRATSSIDASEEVGNVLGRLDGSLEGLVDATTLRQAISALDDTDRYVVVRYFQDGRTQAEIGAELGRSQMHVCRMLKRIVEELRVAVA